MTLQPALATGRGNPRREEGRAHRRSNCRAATSSFNFAVCFLPPATKKKKTTQSRNAASAAVYKSAAHQVLSPHSAQRELAQPANLSAKSLFRPPSVARRHRRTISFLYFFSSTVNFCHTCRPRHLLFLLLGRLVFPRLLASASFPAWSRVPAALYRARPRTLPVVRRFFLLKLCFPPGCEEAKKDDQKSKLSITRPVTSRRRRLGPGVSQCSFYLHYFFLRFPAGRHRCRLLSRPTRPVVCCCR